MARTPADHLRDVLEAIEAILPARLIQIGQAVKDAQAEGVDLPALQPSRTAR